MNQVTRYSPLDDLFRGFFVKPMDFPSGMPTQQIKVDVKETEGGYTVQAEVPGVAKEDIHVSLEGNVVSLRAEVRQHDEKREGEKLLRSERYFGAVARSFQLPADVDAAQAKAKYDNGVLTLNLPKKVNKAAQRLNIE